MRVFVDVMAVFQGQLEIKSCLLTKKNWTKDEGSPFKVRRQKIHRQENGLKDLPSRSLRKETTAMTAFFTSSFFKRMCV